MGRARIDLTPPLAMKATLGGYGARMSKPAEGVHDRVFAKCVVLYDGVKRIAIVTADVLGFPPPVRVALLQKLKANGVSIEEVLLLPSHTHNSFDIFALHPRNIFGIPQIGIYQKASFDHVLEKLTTVITEANKQLVPVKVGTSRRVLPNWCRNRRGAGTTDPEFTLTRIDDLNDKPLAVLCFWAAHPTFLSAKEMLFSCDWPGQLQRTLEAMVANGVQVMYVNGAQGDQSPTPRPNSGESNWEKAEDYGRDLAIEVYPLWQKTKTEKEALFQWKRTTFTLPPRIKHKDFLKVGGAEYGILDKGLEVMLTTLFPTESQTLAFRLGDLLIAGVPGEMIAELGLETKKRISDALGVRYPVIGGLADEWVSYILSARQYQTGGYESTISFYGEKLGETVVEAVVKNAAGLK